MPNVVFGCWLRDYFLHWLLLNLRRLFDWFTVTRPDVKLLNKSVDYLLSVDLLREQRVILFKHFYETAHQPWVGLADTPEVEQHLGQRVEKVVRYGDLLV